MDGHRQHGCTLAEIAVEAGLRKSYVSWIIKAIVARETAKAK
jgi:transcriptional regulator with XRE-family HTH domain